VLIEGNGQRYRLDFKEERRLWDAIERMYMLEPTQRTVSNFTNIVGELKERLHRWTRGGQYGFLFDNAETRFPSRAFRPSISTAGTMRPTFWSLYCFTFYIARRMKSPTAETRHLQGLPAR